MKYIKYYERLEWTDSKDLILINNLFKEYVDSYGIKRVDTFKEISEPGIYYILWDSDVISIEFKEKSGPNKWLINIAYDGDRYEHRCKNLIKILRGDFIKELNKIGFVTKLNGWLEITKLKPKNAKLFETSDIKYHQDVIRDIFQDVIDDYDIDQVDNYTNWNPYSYNGITYNISKVFSENCIRLVFLFNGEGMVGINYFNGKGIPKEFYTKIHNDIKRLDSIGYLVNMEEIGMNPSGRWIQIFIRYT